VLLKKGDLGKWMKESWARAREHGQGRAWLMTSSSDMRLREQQSIEQED